MSKHFGYEANSKICSCGRHYGIGDITPELRAARAKRMQDKMPSLMPPEMVAFLADFEKYHGEVKYTMEEVGINTGTFNKHSKGQPLMGAVYNFYSDKAVKNLFSE